MNAVKARPLAVHAPVDRLVVEYSVCKVHSMHIDSLLPSTQVVCGIREFNRFSATKWSLSVRRTKLNVRIQLQRQVNRLHSTCRPHVYRQFGPYKLILLLLYVYI